MPLPHLQGDPIQSSETDNAIAYAFLPGSTGQTRYLAGIHAAFSAAVAAVKKVTVKRGGTASTGSFTASTLAIGSTDTKVSTTAFVYAILGAIYRKAAVTAGSTLAAGTIPADTWGLYRLSIDTAGTITVTPAAANFTTGYASEALAIAALPDVPDGEADVGYLTVLTASGQPFIGGTDALEGGASGNPATTTNYVSADTVAPDTTVAVFAHDFSSKLPLDLAFPACFRGDPGEGLSVELEASGAGGTKGTVTLFGKTD